MVELSQLPVDLTHCCATPTSQVSQLRDELKQAQNLALDIGRTWQQKLEEAERLQQERIEALKRQGMVYCMVLISQRI